MSIESGPRGKIENKTVTKPESVESAVEILKSKIRKAVALGSLALVLQACMSREEIDKMPTTNIEDINQHGKELMEKSAVKVKGYVQDLGRKGETEETHIFIQEKVTTHHYTLRSGVETNSPSVDMISVDEEDISDNSVGARLVQAIPPSFQKFDPNHQYEILGDVVSREKGKDKSEYVLKIYRHSGVFDLTTAKAEKEK